MREPLARYYTTAHARIQSVTDVAGEDAQKVLAAQKDFWKYAANAGVSVTAENQPQQPDLQYVDSVLVSAGESIGMNKNDDYFGAAETWKAIPTVPSKPADWEHDSNQIIGHMIESFPIDIDGNIISMASKHPTSGTIPTNYNIVNKAVVYKWLFPERAQEISDLAAKNELFVSMEVWFQNYDYRLGDETVQRTAETSFLDSHLRVFGGEGFFDGKKLGRALRDMVFGGIGFVKSPANPGSVIKDTQGTWSISAQSLQDPSQFSLTNIDDSKESFVFDWKSGANLVLVPQVDGVTNSMSKPDKEASQMDELKSRIEALEKELAEAHKTIKTQEQADTTQEIESLKATVSERDEQIQGLNEKVEAAEATVKAHEGCEAEVNGLKEKLEAAEKEIAAVSKQANVIKYSEILKKEFKFGDKKANEIAEQNSEMDSDTFAKYVEDRKMFATQYHEANKAGASTTEPTPDPNEQEVVDNALANADEENTPVPSASGSDDDGFDKEVAAGLGFKAKE